MASETILKQKQEYVEQLAEQLKNAAAGVIVSYKGISVEDDTKLRKELREAGVKYFVVKNTMLSRAAEQAGLTGFDGVFKGSTALAISEKDPIAAAKILADFAGKHDFFELKAGFVEGKTLDAAGVKELATIPTPDVLYFKLAYILLSGIRGLAVALNAIAEKESA